MTSPSPLSVVPPARKRLEEKLLESATLRLRLIFDQASDVISLYHLDGRTVEISTAVSHTFGWSPEALAGRSIFDLVHRDDEREVRASVDAARAVRGRSRMIRYRLLRADGSFADAESVVRIVSDPLDGGGCRDRIFAFTRDVTSRAAVEALGRDAFVMLSHDLKNRLSAILAFVSLERGTNDPAELAQLVDRVEASTRRAVELTANFTELMRLQSGAFEPRFTLGSINDSALAARTTCDVQARLGRQRVDLDLAETLPAVRLDRSLFDRAVENILSNALKFSPEGSPILLQTRFDDHRSTVRLAVMDRGPGVPVEKRPRLFERFSGQASGVRSGAGLGLYIVRSVVVAHGGSVAYSEGPDGGARFEIEVPSAEGTAALPRASRKEDAPVTGLESTDGRSNEPGLPRNEG